MSWEAGGEAARKWVERLDGWQPYLLALAIYAASRAVVALGLWLGDQYVPFSAADWHTTVGSDLLHRLLRWDSFWYLRIAVSGYSYDGNPAVSHPVNFYPLYPLASRLVADLLRIQVHDALLLVSNLSSLAAIVLLTRLVRRDHGDDVAMRTIAFVSFFPSSLFLSAGLTEGPTLMLFVLFFLMLRDERWLLAATCAGLASATRPAGLVLLPVLAWAIWLKHCNEPRRLLLRGAVCLAVAASGLTAYMAYLWWAFGDPLSFAKAHAAWEPKGTTFGSRVLDGLTLRTLWDVPHLGTTFADLRFWFFVFYAALAILCWRRLSSSMALFTSGVLLFPYLTVSRLYSFNRYGFVAFPVFIVLADLCRSRPWLTCGILVIFAGLLALSSALFGQWHWVG